MVLEMGMNHLNEMSRLSMIAHPDVSCITNVGTAHIGELGSRENILKAKLEITDGMKDQSTLIINNDNDMLQTVDLPRLNVVRVGKMKGLLFKQVILNYLKITVHLLFIIMIKVKKFGFLFKESIMFLMR